MSEHPRIIHILFHIRQIHKLEREYFFSSQATIFVNNIDERYLALSERVRPLDLYLRLVQRYDICIKLRYERLIVLILIVAL